MIETAARYHPGFRVRDRKGCAKVCESTKWGCWARLSLETGYLMSM